MFMRSVRNSVIIFLITFALLEASLRLYHYVSPVFIFPDNSDNRFRSKPFTLHYGFRLNSLGFIDTEFHRQKDPNTIRIVGIGDSFVFGIVPYRYNFLTLLEDHLNTASDRPSEVFNMGINRTSPREYYSVLVKEALPLKPDVVLICIFVGNDFIEVKRKPVLHRSFVISAARYLYDALRKIEAANVYGDTGEYNDDAPTFTEPYFLEIEAMRTEIYRKSSSMLGERLPRVMSWMDEIKEVCQSNGIQLVVMIIPDEVQLDPELRDRVLGELHINKQDMDFDLPNKRLAEELAARDIRHLDLTEPFRSGSRVTRLYKLRDTHWNIAGNQLAAELLYNFLHESLEFDERTPPFAPLH